MQNLIFIYDERWENEQQILKLRLEIRIEWILFWMNTKPCSDNDDEK